MNYFPNFGLKPSLQSNHSARNDSQMRFDCIERGQNIANILPLLVIHNDLFLLIQRLIDGGRIFFFHARNRLVVTHTTLDVLIFPSLDDRSDN